MKYKYFTIIKTKNFLKHTLSWQLHCNIISYRNYIFQFNYIFPIDERTIVSISLKYKYFTIVKTLLTKNFRSNIDNIAAHCKTKYSSIVRNIYNISRELNILFHGQNVLTIKSRISREINSRRTLRHGIHRQNSECTSPADREPITVPQFVEIRFVGVMDRSTKTVAASLYERRVLEFSTTPPDRTVIRPAHYKPKLSRDRKLGFVRLSSFIRVFLLLFCTYRRSSTFSNIS